MTATRKFRTVSDAEKECVANIMLCCGDAFVPGILLPAVVQKCKALYNEGRLFIWLMQYKVILLRDGLDRTMERPNVYKKIKEIRFQ